jgi:hypothetical protein
MSKPRSSRRADDNRDLEFAHGGFYPWLQTITGYK